MGNKASSQSTSEAFDHRIAALQQEINQLDEQIAQFKIELDSPSPDQPDTRVQQLQRSMEHLNESLGAGEHAELKELQEIQKLIQESLKHRSKLLIRLGRS